MLISYNWLQNYFEKELPSPEKIADGIIFHSFEVEEIYEKDGDTIFDIKVLPDRAHDCFSHWGVAKEISAIFDLEIKNKKYKIFEPKPTKLDIRVEDNRCLRYMGRIVTDVKVGESPEWLKNNLKSIGQKSINSLVDIANFVMFDLGQPIHCFDLDKLENKKLIIRKGKNGEKIKTLDKKDVDIDESILIIADELEPLVIAGIKGGMKAEVDANTKNIVIEVANFDGVSTRKTTKKIGIVTDASRRYDNGITPELTEKTMDAVTDLISELAGGEPEEIVDIYPEKAEQKTISISVDYINKRLGTDFSKDEIASVWKKLNFDYKEKDNSFEITIPFLRLDLTGAHDLVEEVVRILGYERIEAKMPEIKQEQKVNEVFSKTLLARNKMLEDGYSEIMTYVFRDKGELEVLASASDKNFLRTNISDGLKESIILNQKNLPLLEADEVKVFEIGTVFNKNGEQINIAFGDKKNVTEMALNRFIELHFGNIFNKYEELSALVTKNISRYEVEMKEQAFKPWSIYPFITRDIAVWVPEEEGAEKLVDIYKSFGTELLVREPRLFDSFTKEINGVKKTSFAYRLVFQSYDRTLTDEEVNQIMLKITEKIVSLGWQVR